MTGNADQGLSLPKGGGAVQSLGETFQPDFHTGTGAYAIPLDLPNGPDDLTPRLTLLYSTAAGQGAFGLGFGLNLLTIGRSTNRRVPTYSDDDPLVLHGGGELLDAGGGRLRLRNETSARRITRAGDGFEVLDTDGTVSRLGVTDQARRVVGPGRVLDWLLEETVHPLGATIRYRWRRDGGQVYLDRVEYGPYAVAFRYEQRPDPVLDGRSGVLVRTDLRCTAAELSAPAEPQPLIRRWAFAYSSSDPAGHSLLSRVTLTGFGADDTEATLPPLSLGYTGFAPRQLERFRGETPDAVPDASGGGRRELVDWTGDGLPDLVELRAGRGRVWRNLGDCTWARPETLAAVAAPVGLDEPGVAFADMEGNGTADLLMLDRGLTGYHPRRPNGGFDRPVFWRRGPSTRLSDPDAALLDLDADGIADLLVTADQNFTLHLRDGSDGWRERPVTVPRTAAPPISLGDPRVRVADMNGDGFADLVRIDGAGVIYWPYLGNGSWAAAVRMSGAPDLPTRFDPTRLFLADVDGDGCADLVYVDGDRVLYWLNSGGTRLAQGTQIRFTPSTPADRIQLADMRGRGTAGVLWTTTAPGRRGTSHLFLDLAGGAKPYLLDRIDNGMGLLTRIQYGTSTEEAARDRRAGTPWRTFLPFPVPVVAGLSVTETSTGRVAESVFRYHEGHYDGVGREFCGFREVEVTELGDEAAPTLLTRNRYHLGLDPSDPGRTLTEDERVRLRTLRGKLLRADTFGLDGSPDEARPYTRTEGAWTAETIGTAAGLDVIAVRQHSTTVTSFERGTEAYRVTIDHNLGFDPDGNVTERKQTAEDPRVPGSRRVLRTVTSYAAAPDGRVRGRIARTTQTDGDGTVVATSIHYYDDRPEGKCGPAGLLTRLECLVLTDATAAEVYGDAPPDLAALGYHRRPGEDGWWIDQFRWSRTDGAAGLRGQTADALGHITRIEFDGRRLHPARLVDPLDNASSAEFDIRANKIRALTDPNGATITNAYDPLGRIVTAVEPGATDARPTQSYAYRTDGLPVSVACAQRAVDGTAFVVTTRTFYDGQGELLEERRSAPGGGEICVRAQRYSARGLVRSQFLPRLATEPDFVAPGDDLPHTEFRYDAIGRMVGQQNADGSSRTIAYGAGVADSVDELGAMQRLVYNPTGRLEEVTAGGAVTRYGYDVKGNVTSVTGPDDRTSRFAYDLLGHRLRTESPASGATVFVFDAAGNLVRRTDARGLTVAYAFDALNRLHRVTFADTGEESARYEYDDTAAPLAGAGPFGRGRLARVTHAGGAAAYGYDAHGRVTSTTMTGPGLPTAGLRLDYTFRADGARDTITYPAPGPGGGRLQLNHEYDARGLLQRIPGFVRLIERNAAGLRTRVVYANGVVTTYDYDPATLRLTALRTVDGAGAVLQEFGYAHDLVGNLTTVTSPEPAEAATYTYDDAYRLRVATHGDGTAWTFAYDVAGNLTERSGVGSYTYDGSGRLASAGTDVFDYTAAGQTATGPWGTGEYDPAGRLTAVVAGQRRTEFAYDHGGRRVRAAVTDGGAVVGTVLTPDDLVAVEDGVLVLSIVDGATRVAQLRPDTGAVAFLHGDHLGSTTLVTGLDGAVLQRVAYDPFGAVLTDDVAPGAAGTRYLYTGAELDPTGLVYLRARYYDPRIGRFLTPDTLVPHLHDPQAWNRYSYVRNNPLRFVDPTGHFWEEVGEWFEENWQAVVAVLVIIAVVVLTVVTFGVGGLVAVGIGMAIGGAIGGISAGMQGGDILSGILVGMAVGGAAAFAGLGIGAGMSAAFGKGALATIAASTLSGAVSGAAMGFATGYAGGAGNAATIWDRMWKGALIGAITGLVLGGFSAWFQYKGGFGPRTPTSWTELRQGAEESAAGAAKAAGQAGAVGPGTAGGVALGALTGSANTGGYWLSPLLGGGSVLGAANVAAYQVAAIGLTSAASGVFVMDWADDLWNWAVGSDLVKYEQSGTDL